LAATVGPSVARQLVGGQAGVTWAAGPPLPPVGLSTARASDKAAGERADTPGVGPVSSCIVNMVALDDVSARLAAVLGTA
jgi:hypothetical protein